MKLSEFEKVTNLLETSARDHKNNDALLLLAELNFVSKIYTFFYKSNTNYYLVFKIRTSPKLQSCIKLLPRISQ